VPEGGRPWEHVENHRRACNQVFSYVKQSWYFPLVIRSCLLKTGFFRHIKELKIQRKNPGNDLRAIYLCPMNAPRCAKRKRNKKIRIDFPSHVATKLLHQKSSHIQITVPGTNVKFQHTNN
jgi:hypothetical protein